MEFLNGKSQRPTPKRVFRGETPAVHHCSQIPLGGFGSKDQGVVLTSNSHFSFTKDLATTRLPALSLWIPACSNPTSNPFDASKASRARFPGSGCFPRLAVD